MAAGALATLKKLWRHNRWLTLAFLITLTLALVFLIRASIFFVYWQNHADEPIQGWMTIRYIAKSYRVDPELVHDAIGLPQTGPDRRPLIRIARDTEQPLDKLTQAIVTAIDAARAARGMPNSNPQDPATPERP